VSGAELQTQTGEKDRPALLFAAGEDIESSVSDTMLVAAVNGYGMTVQSGTVTLEKVNTVSPIAVSSGSLTITQDTSINKLTVEGGSVVVQGGALHMLVVEGGTGTVTGGTVNEAEVNGEGNGLSANGGIVSTVKLAGKNSILHTNGKAAIASVSLTGTDSHIELSAIPETEDSIPVTKLNVSTENQNDGQILVVCPEDISDSAAAAVNRFLLSPSEMNSYLLLDTKDNNIILKMEGIFVDTEYGDDTYNDGLSSSTAVKTFKKATELLQEKLQEETAFQPRIIVVGEAKIKASDSLEWPETGDENDEKVSVCVVPYEKDCPVLITVEKGGALTLANITLDGGCMRKTAASAQRSK
jgi:hypothetical protein